MATKTPTLAEQYEAAEKAQRDAEAKRTVLAEAERQADLERRRRRAAAWQTWLDTYDPAALRADVDAAEANVRTALQTSDLGRALVDAIAARMRRNAHVDLARQAHAAGATGAGDDEYDVIGDAVQHIGQLLPALVVEAAQAQVAAEREQVEAGPAAAYASVDAREPVAVKVNSGRAEDYVDVLGDLRVEFIGGVAFLGTDHPAIGYYERTDGYAVTAVYGVPSVHAAAAARLAADTQHEVRVGTPAQSG